MSDLNSDNSRLWSGPSRVFPRWIRAVAPKANCRLSWMGFRGRGLSCGRSAASLRLTGCAGHRPLTRPDASNPAVPIGV